MHMQIRPHACGLISTFYAQLLNPPPYISLHYAVKGERNLGLQIEAKDCSDIWAASKSASQNTVTLETNYKVLMCWYLVPAWIAKYPPNYSHTCFLGCSDAGTHHYTWWSCHLAQAFWAEIFCILSTLFDNPLDPDPATDLLNKKPLDITRLQFKLLLQVTST